MAYNSAESGLMATYDANDTTIVVNGKQLYGFGEDTMFTSSYDNDTVSVSQDPQGTSVASKNNKTGGTITINLSEASPCNKQLHELATKGNFPVDIITSTIHITAPHCYITKKPDASGAGQVGNQAWQIKALNMTSSPLA